MTDISTPSWSHDGQWLYFQALSEERTSGYQFGWRGGDAFQ